MPNGAILGVGTNKHLYIRKTLYSKWKHVPYSCCVNDVTTMTINGKQVIVGTNGANFYTKRTLNARWQHAHSANGKGLVIAGAGRALFGVSSNHDVYIRAGLRGKWYGLPETCDVKDIVFQKNTLYGVGTDNMLVEKKLPRFSVSARGFKVLTNNFKSWKYHGKSTCCVKSIGIPSRPISTKIKIIGVGLNKQLYFKTSLTDSWTHVSKSGSVTKITVLRDGTLVGIGTNKHLYYRNSVDDAAWKHVAHSCCVKGIAQLPNGHIVGIGTNNHMYVRPALQGRWKHVRGSCCVTSIAVRPDGAVIGYGARGSLFMRKNLYAKWTGPLRHSKSPAVIDLEFGKDGFLYGVASNKRIMKKSCRSVQASWKYIPSHNCCVTSIAVS
eukprot:Seg649.14 transcript_id=Seg649.14/GoldUCD/mRNA.D3Y31 product="hypothetical protein" protein_id=Seg649.14/GoldUCD/D3Y31